MRILGIKDFIAALRRPDFRFMPFIIVTEKVRNIDCDYHHVYSLFVHIKAGSLLQFYRVPDNVHLLVFGRISMGAGSQIRVSRFPVGSSTHPTNLETI